MVAYSGGGGGGTAKSKFVIVRVSPEQHSLFAKVAKAQGQSISTIIRESALKALINELTLAIVSKEELAAALNVDKSIIDFILSKEAPPAKVAPRSSEV